MIYVSVLGFFLSVLALTGSNTAPTIDNLPLASPPLSVNENSNLGSAIFTVTGSDVDGDTLFFTAVYTTSGGAALFSLDSSSGVVTLSTSTVLNFETLGGSPYDIEVYVSDGTASTSATLQISIADVSEAPSFPQTQYTTSANEGPASTAFPSSNFGATDDDGDTVTYALSCGSYTSRFTMDPTSGDISYTQDYDLDTSGTPSSISCTVTASDGTLSSTANLVIYINSLNDNIPQFLQSEPYVFVADAANPVGTVVGTVSASDADIDPAYGTITYTVDVSGLADTYFGVTSVGEIYINKDLSSFSGSGTSFTFNAIASDVDSQSDTIAVSVIISATTTVVTTTTTTTYKTFFEDTRTIVWFSLCMAAAFAILVLFFVYCWYLDWLMKIMAGIRYLVSCCICHCKCPERPRPQPKPRPKKIEIPKDPTPPPSPEPVPLEPKPNPESRPWDFWTKTGDIF